MGSVEPAMTRPGLALGDLTRWVSRASGLPRVLRHLVTHPATRGRRLAALYRYAAWQARKRLRPEPVTIDAFDGARLRCHPDNTATSSVIYLGWPDWHEMHFLRRILRPGDTFLDIGANVGVYSVLAARCIQPGGTLHAIEADPLLVQRLEENLRLNGFSSESVHAVAVGESSGICRFEIDRDTVGNVLPSSAPGGADLPMRRLDDLFTAYEPFTIAKLDIEGYELQALRGAERLLRAQRPRCWLIETNRAAERYGTTREPLQALLAEHGFRLYAIEDRGNALRPIPPGGPYPENALAAADLDWLRQRIPGLRVIP
jgi:FkbM family methyltransferase